MDSRNLGNMPLNAHYGFDHDGFGWSTSDNEHSLRMRALMRVEARIYSPAGQNIATSGIHRPQSDMVGAIIAAKTRHDDRRAFGFAQLQPLERCGATGSCR